MEQIKYLKVTPNKGYQRTWLTIEKINKSKKFKFLNSDKNYVHFSHPMDKDDEYTPYCNIKFPLNDCKIIDIIKINNLWHWVYKDGTI